ncbi:uncharacterized protein LOC107988660 [Cynoglossus semilaevis]|nr:uncharacterized protein LOC107988660 [Cynoglossus semilaevis]
MSPGVVAQMADIISNGLPSSITQQSQSYAELILPPAYQGDLLTKGTKEESNTEKEASTCNSVKKELEKSEQGREEEMDDVAKWQILKNNILEQEEVGHANSDYQGLGEKLDKSGQWGRGVAEFPISSLESLTPGQADPLQYQSGLLSFFRSQGNLSTAPARVHKDILNGGGNLENDVASAPKPFQCRYCPYSASQKGNLKTHVVCVHRRPFDNTLYPDRRLRRSHTPQRASRLPPTIAGDNHASGRDQIGVTSLCGT